MYYWGFFPFLKGLIHCKIMNRNLEDNGTSAITCSFCIAYFSLTLLPAPPWIFFSGAHSNKCSFSGGFAGGPVVKTLPPNAGGGVQSLVGELRSHMTHGEAKRLENRKKEMFLLQVFHSTSFFLMESNTFLTQCFLSLPKHISLSDNQEKSSVPLGCFKGCVLNYESLCLLA